MHLARIAYAGAAPWMLLRPFSTFQSADFETSGLLEPMATDLDALAGAVPGHLSEQCKEVALLAHGFMVRSNAALEAHREVHEARTKVHESAKALGEAMCHLLAQVGDEYERRRSVAMTPPPHFL